MFHPSAFIALATGALYAYTKSNAVFYGGTILTIIDAAMPGLLKSLKLRKENRELRAQGLELEARGLELDFERFVSEAFFICRKKSIEKTDGLLLSIRSDTEQRKAAFAAMRLFIEKGQRFQNALDIATLIDTALFKEQIRNLISEGESILAQFLALGEGEARITEAYEKMREILCEEIAHYKAGIQVLQARFPTHPFVQQIIKGLQDSVQKRSLLRIPSLTEDDTRGTAMSALQQEISSLQTLFYQIPSEECAVRLRNPS